MLCFITWIDVFIWFSNQPCWYLNYMFWIQALKFSSIWVKCIISISLLCELNWYPFRHAQSDFSYLSYDEDCFILNAYWTINVIMLFWSIIWWKWYLVCVLPPYMSCVNVLRWLYWLLLRNKQQGTWLQDGEGRMVILC